MELKKKISTTNTKTIKAPGSSIERVAQACDRCRAKKTKCDGKKPACSSCATIGIKCIVSDKLSRRAFPKGYTETLEERIRQLEAENKRLVGLVDLRDEQLELLNGNKLNDSLTSTNLSLLQNKLHEDGCPCGCENHPHSLHERPVSIAGSVHEGSRDLASSVNLSDDNDSLLSFDDILLVDSSFHPINSNEVRPAPGAFAAATAIAKMQSKHEFENKQQMLTSLVAISLPRLTEETLFIPTLLAKICQVYGYNSKPAVLTANSIALLKESPPRPKDYSDSDVLNKLIMNRDDVTRLDDAEAIYFIKNLIGMPDSRIDLDHLTTVYFQEWGNILPVLHKDTFLKNYVNLTNILELGHLIPEYEPISSYELIEKFSAIIILILSLALLSSSGSDSYSSNLLSSKSKELEYYDYLIHEFIKPHCIITRHCSIQSLQILALALQYCLAIGDLTTCYELRGRTITMAQQLRLHRCPAAVLGISGNNMENANLRNLMQGERRILFWCIYCLDIYSSLNLGVPRLLKDFEVECAMPFAGNKDDDDINENILVVNNTKLSIVGKVSKFSLSFMLYCKVLGEILDSIFSRFEDTNFHKKALNRDQMLDCWRRELSSDLKFEIDVNGFTTKTLTDLESYNKYQLTFMFLYYHAKILIYLPIISKYGNHHDVGLSQKERLTKGDEEMSNIVTSISMIQQSSIQILECLKCLLKGLHTLSVPLNVSREMARFSLLVAQGSLDYIRGGPLFQNLKQLLLETISLLIKDSDSNIPNKLTRSSVKLLEMAILSILGLNTNKGSLKKKPTNPQQPITKTAVAREPNQRRPIGKSKLNDDSLPIDLSVLENELYDENENLEDILMFDPFKVDLSRKVMNDEFVTDGSLGLVPFLDGNGLLSYSEVPHAEDITQSY
ncbi:uncharacterized protein PRCAT00003046001 [Priceomyces carsonii]|uniref:uncharacterized protein n=1 Tax=Priceomyces carsonii TaxID=28549 RepID=UPI002ED9FC06|nr:unnamed protein product [Priceomyces carsonii]